MWENRKFLLFAIPLCAYLLTSFFFLLLCCCFFTHHTQLLDAISPLTYILRLYIFPQNNTSASLAMGKVFSSLYLKTRQLQQQISMNFIQGHEAAIFIFISWYFHSFSTWDFYMKTFPHTIKIFKLFLNEINQFLT